MPDNKDFNIEIEEIKVEPSKTGHKMSSLLKFGGVFLVAGAVLLVPGIMGLVSFWFPAMSFFLCIVLVFLDAVRDKAARGGYGDTDTPIYPNPNFFND